MFDGILSLFKGPVHAQRRRFVCKVIGLVLVACALTMITDPVTLSMDVIVMAVIFIAGLNIEQAYKGVKIEEKLDRACNNFDNLKEQININIDIANKSCKERKYQEIR